MEFRHSVQLIFIFLFLFLTGAVCSFKMGVIFISCPLGVLQAIGATKIFLLSAIIASLALVILTLFFGRLFCGWICPVGTITEHGGKFFPQKKKGLPSNTRNIKYGLLASIILGAVVFKYAIFCTICPIGVTCRSVSFQGLLLSPELLLIPLLLFAEAYERRTWCKHICPVGALLALISRVKLFRLQIDLEKCVRCNRCVRECKKDQMDILGPNSFITGLIRNDECNFCLQCSEVCNKNAIEVVNVLKNRNAAFNAEKKISSKIGKS